MHATTVFAHVHADTCIQKLENNVDAFRPIQLRVLAAVFVAHAEVSSMRLVLPGDGAWQR